MRLIDKTAIITGAGQTPGSTTGNGRAMAVRFAREGAKVLLVDRDEDSVRDTQGMIEAEGGESAVITGDVTNAADCERVVTECLKRWQRVDILVNNVGVGVGDSILDQLSEDVWQRIIETNLSSMFLMCKQVLEPMRNQGGGSILNISSIASIAATPLLAYRVSKAGVNALTQQIASTYASQGIRCNAILPGLMNTPMAVEGTVQATGLAREEVIRRRDKAVPMGKMGTAWDVASAAVYLASDEASFVTGVLLPVDGGQSIRVG